jgi:hypothetical protein
MNSAFRRMLGNEAHVDLALAAFLRFQNLVRPMLVTESDAMVSLLASVSSTIEASSASQTIQRAFEAAKGSKP